MATGGNHNKKSPESRPNTGTVERLTDLKAKRFLDDFETLSENQQEDLLLFLHGAVVLQGDEGKGKKIKQKGGSDSKAKKKTKVSTSKAADAKRKSYSDATVGKNVTTSPQHDNNGNNDPGKTKPQTTKVLQPVILKTPTGKIQKGDYQVFHKLQVNRTALKRMCDEDNSNEPPSKYQKAEKIIMEKSSILQELDDLRELDVEVIHFHQAHFLT